MPEVSELIRLSDHRQLDAPLVIAGFAGQYGQTPALAVRHLVEAWEAQPLAELDPEEFFDFTVQRPVVWTDGDTRQLDWPAHRFYAARLPGLDQDVVLLPGLEPHLRWRTFCEVISRFMAQHGATALLTLGARRGSVPHSRRRPVRLFGAEGAVARSFGMPVASSTYEGPVGIATVLREVASTAGIETLTLEAMTPFYLPSAFDPDAALALIQTLDEGLGTSTSVTELESQSQLLVQQVEGIMRQVPQLATTARWLEQQFEWLQHQAASEKRPHRALPESFGADEVVAEVEAFLQNHGRGSGHTSGMALE